MPARADRARGVADRGAQAGAEPISARRRSARPFDYRGHGARPVVGTKVPGRFGGAAPLRDARAGALRAPLEGDPHDPLGLSATRRRAPCRPIRRGFPASRRRPCPPPSGRPRTFRVFLSRSCMVEDGLSRCSQYCAPLLPGDLFPRLSELGAHRCHRGALPGALFGQVRVARRKSAARAVPAERPHPQARFRACDHARGRGPKVTRSKPRRSNFLHQKHT